MTSDPNAIRAHLKEMDKEALIDEYCNHWEDYSELGLILLREELRSRGVKPESLHEPAPASAPGEAGPNEPLVPAGTYYDPGTAADAQDILEEHGITPYFHGEIVIYVPESQAEAARQALAELHKELEENIQEEGN
jgi:hypothetical protein